MEQMHIPNSFRNILLLSKHQYKLALRKRDWIFLLKDEMKSCFSYNFLTKSQDIQEHYGFQTNNCPSYIK